MRTSPLPSPPSHTSISQFPTHRLSSLTTPGLSLATATFVSGLLADLALSPRLFTLKNNLAATAASLEVVVSILYWGLRIVTLPLPPPTHISAPPLTPPPDRPRPRNAHLGGAARDLRRPRLPLRARAAAHLGPATAVAAVAHNDRRVGAHARHQHRFRLRVLVLGRAVLRPQRLLPVSDLRGAQHALARRAVRVQWLLDDGECVWA